MREQIPNWFKVEIPTLNVNDTILRARLLIATVKTANRIIRNVCIYISLGS